MNTPLRLISSMATRELLTELVSSWPGLGRQPVEATAAGGVDVATGQQEATDIDDGAVADQDTAGRIEPDIASGGLGSGSCVAYL